jgi:hypothetical protein
MLIFLRIPDTGSRIRLFSITDHGFRISNPGSELSPSWIPDPSKNSSIFNPKKTKKWYLSSKNMIRVVHPGSRIRMLTFYPSRIPDPRSRGQKGTVSRLPDPQNFLNWLPHLSWWWGPREGCEDILFIRDPLTLQRKSPLYIPFLGIARPQPQFQHSCVCEQFL